MSRAENVAIFEDTMHICKTNPVMANAIKLTNEHQEIIPETEDILLAFRVWEEEAKIIISKKRSFEAAKQYIGKKVCVLNFASATTPGGGVTWGSNAQEECLCRCSTLYSNLNVKENWDGFYGPHRQQQDPLYNADCIYTPDVLVFKSDTVSPKLLNPDEWMYVNVITCAAPNLRPDRYTNVRPQISAAELEKLHIERMRRILSIAAARENEVVILGAFGCGAFQNPPEVVAKAMKKVIGEFCRNFRVIEFAVYCAPWDERNYAVFQNVLAGK